MGNTGTSSAVKYCVNDVCAGVGIVAPMPVNDRADPRHRNVRLSVGGLLTGCIPLNTAVRFAVVLDARLETRKPARGGEGHMGIEHRATPSKSFWYSRLLISSCPS